MFFNNSCKFTFCRQREIPVWNNCGRQYKVLADLTGSFVGSHLQADGGLVVGFIRLGLWIVQVPPGSIGGHSSLTRTLVGAHLEKERSGKGQWGEGGLLFNHVQIEKAANEVQGCNQTAVKSDLESDFFTNKILRNHCPRWVELCQFGVFFPLLLFSTASHLQWRSLVAPYTEWRHGRLKPIGSVLFRLFMFTLWTSHSVWMRMGWKSDFLSRPEVPLTSLKIKQMSHSSIFCHFRRDFHLAVAFRGQEFKLPAVQWHTDQPWSSPCRNSSLVCRRISPRYRFLCLYLWSLPITGRKKGKWNQSYGRYWFVPPAF